MDYKFNFFKYSKIGLINFLRHFRSVSFLNLSLMTGFIIYNKNSLTIENKSQKKIYSKGSDKFNYLIPFEMSDYDKFVLKKCPKIIHFTGLGGSDTVNNLIGEIDSTLLQKNFEKIHSKFKDLDSYVLSCDINLKWKNEVNKILQNYGTELNKIFPVQEDYQIKEELRKKPFLFINKYGDIKFLSLNEYNDVTQSDAIFPYFEKLSILNNKHDLLLQNDYEYLFLIYLDTKKIDYTSPIFKTFRKMFHLINFFNIKFYVATPDHSKFLSNLDLKLNNVYAVKRYNMIDTTNENCVEFENENFKLINLTDNFMELNNYLLDEQKFALNLTKVLTSKLNFMYYIGAGFKKKQGVEILNLYFKDTPYYLLYTNLKNDLNKIKLNDMFQVFNSRLNDINENFAVVVIDNDKVISFIFNLLE
jgi:hypothetical protein